MFVKGGQISERGAKFPRKYGPGGGIFPRKFGPGEPYFGGGGKFPGTPGNDRLFRLLVRTPSPFVLHKTSWRNSCFCKFYSEFMTKIK